MTAIIDHKSDRVIFLEFVVVHNGILTNYKELKEFLFKHNYKFESETDTEVIAKLIQ